jgi:hypothetical protein
VDGYVDAHEESASINWQEFRTLFRLHHVPQGIIKMKKKEFQDLKQGSMSVSEYITCFTQLSHYAASSGTTYQTLVLSPDMDYMSTRSCLLV